MKSLLQLLALLLAIVACAGAGFYILGPSLTPGGGDESSESALPETPEGTGRQLFQDDEGEAGGELADSSTDWGALNNEAVEALKAKDFERAMELLERCVEAEPDEDTFKRNLAQVLAESALELHAEFHPCDVCIEMLERAMGLAPDRDDVAKLLDKWRTEADVEDGFWSESSLYFDLSYDGSRKAILHDSYRVLNFLDQSYGELRDQFGRDPVRKNDQRIGVVLYAREGFKEVTGLDWAGGAFDGVVRIPVDEHTDMDSPKLKQVLTHELVHAFVVQVGGKSVPGWLNEGLAQLLEPQAAASVESAGKALSGSSLFPFSELQGSLATWTDAKAVGRAYAQSLAFCNYVAYRYGDRLLFDMVATCAEDQSPADFFRQRTGVELDRALKDFADQL